MNEKRILLAVSVGIGSIISIVVILMALGVFEGEMVDKKIIGMVIGSIIVFDVVAIIKILGLKNLKK